MKLNKNKKILIAVFALLFVVSCFAVSAFLGSRIINELRDTPENDCIQTFEVSETSDYSMYSVVFQVDESEEQREEIPAFDPDTLAIIVFPLEIEGNPQMDGESFLYSRTTDGGVFLNYEFFSNIKRVSVHSGDGREKIGTYKKYDAEDFEFSKVFRFLLESEILSSYDHLYSEICLEEIEEDDDEYKAHYSGMHEYCTNDCYEETFEFDMILDKSNGDIWVNR